MAGQREKALKLDHFMNNTGTDKTEATQILTRNNWNMDASYKDVEKMSRRSSQPNHAHGQSSVGNQGRLGSPKGKAIDMGVGAAVHLDKRAPGIPVSMPQPMRQVADNATFHRQHGPDLSNQSTSLSVKLPQSSTAAYRQERIIPIHTEDGRTVLPTRSYAGYKPLAADAPQNSMPYGRGQNPVPSQSYQVSTVKGNLQSHPQPRVTIDEPVSHSKPYGNAPVDKTNILPDSIREDDDVFDEKAFTKPPPVSTLPRLKRGFSNIIENENLVSEARHSVKTDIMKDSHEMYIQTFVLPDLTVYSDDFRAFLGKELIETSTLVSLEQAGRLNWWAELRLCQRLLPMATSGDGNCLLHAASLAMWGIHDRQLILRKELHETLTKAPYKDALYRRWRYQQTMTNKESGLVFNEAEWKEEWENILRLASPLPRGAPDPARSNNCCDSPVTQGCEEPVVYESLEEFHVFVLAHVLQRPIIVVADAILKDSSGEALAPIPFPGIYLPLEVQKCFKSPLLLTYDAAHFSALSPMEQDPSISPRLPVAIPLVDPELKLLPLHFHIDPGPKVDWSKDLSLEPSLEDKINLLQKFLEVDRLPLKLCDVNGDSDRGSCGSQDSDDIGAFVKEKDKKKEEKKKDARMSQQVQTVAKQFGSIGKSMGKKLKQLGKVGKGDKSRRQSVGNEITQSTRVISTYGNQNNGQETVLVAKLSENRGKQQQEMIRNYLDDAEARFRSDRELKRRSDAELRSKVALHPAVPPVTLPCNTPGCDLFGTAQTNNYCTKCHAARQRESMVQKTGGGNFVYNTFPGRAKPQVGPPALSDEIFRCGKSKFYTSSNEDVDQAGPDSLTVANLDKQSSRSNNSINYAPRLRSPSPDYDNLMDPRSQGNTHVQSNIKPQSNWHTQERQQCRTSGCEFYGSPESDGLCSKCYQKKYQESLARASKGTTRL